MSFGYRDMGYTSPRPNAADFTCMLRDEIGIPISSLTPANRFVIMSLAYAEKWVYKRLAAVDLGIYLRAVYCLATDRMVNIAQDPPSGASTVFHDLRSQFSIYSFTSGVISGSSDESTAQSFAVATSLNDLTLADLQNMKTPWGREYLGYAQQGYPIWGLS